jgi:signal recognition particle subunit SRP54
MLGMGGEAPRAEDMQKLAEKMPRLPSNFPGGLPGLPGKLPGLGGLPGLGSPLKKK